MSGFLKSLLVVLVLPPMNLVFVVVGGLILARYRPRAGRIMSWVGILGLLALSLPVVSGAMMRSLESGLPLVPSADAPPGAIVILGAEVSRTMLGPEPVIVGRLTLERMRAGMALARQTGLPVLVTGGTLQPTHPPVGRLMAKSAADDFRMPVKWVEDKSRDTWENATMSAEKLQSVGIRSVYVVTHAWHMRRALAAFKRTGLVAIAAPTGIEPPNGVIPTDFIPRETSWLGAYYAFHEWLGLAWYTIR